MAQTIEEFAKQCSTILKAEPGPAGRQKVCDLLKEVLKDKEFVEKTIPDSTSERHLRLRRSRSQVLHFRAQPPRPEDQSAA